MREKTIFERIVDDEIPSQKVLESDEFLAFKDINPKAPVHLLVIPKAYYKDFQEFKPELMAKMTSFIQELAILTGADKTGYKLITNCGAGAGQEVFHLHFHFLADFKEKPNL